MKKVKRSKKQSCLPIQRRVVDPYQVTFFSKFIKINKVK
jgi:hypothetical protein